MSHRFAAACGLLAVGCLIGAQEPAAPPKAEEEALIAFTATVEAIDVENRVLTLKGPQGNVVDISVDPRVRRLGEIAVGDSVNVGYYVSVAAELRPATPAEAANPFEVIKDRTVGPADASPSGAAARVVHAVASVEGVDRPSRSVTLKGPRGRTYVARVSDPAVLRRLRIDDTIFITVTEALAVSVDKAAPRQP